MATGNTSGDNNEKNVKEAEKQMKKLQKRIKAQEKYNVRASMQEGIYTWIFISEAK